MIRYCCLFRRYIKCINNPPHTEVTVSTKPFLHRDSVSPRSFINNGWVTVNIAAVIVVVTASSVS